MWWHLISNKTFCNVLISFKLCAPEKIPICCHLICIKRKIRIVSKNCVFSQLDCKVSLIYKGLFEFRILLVYHCIQMIELYSILSWKRKGILIGGIHALQVFIGFWSWKLGSLIISYFFKVGNPEISAWPDAIITKSRSIRVFTNSINKDVTADPAGGTIIIKIDKTGITLICTRVRVSCLKTCSVTV